jgi:hypothetical protein|nr:hypothetical protein [Kofleriaceae bacterium]
MRRTTELHGELGALADIELGWWLLAGGAAVAETLRAPSRYVISDAEPWADTFIGHAVPSGDLVRRAIARAHAARLALRELDGRLPEQPLAVSLKRTPAGAIAERSALDVAAFAIGDRAWWATLADEPSREHDLAADLAVAIAGGTPRAMRSIGHGATPFVTVTLGDEPAAVARHGHRRGWHGGEPGSDAGRGPWLGLARAGGMDIASTCHMAVDGYGHAWLSGRIAELADELAPRVASTDVRSAPAPSVVAGVIPLGVAWRALSGPAPRALPLAYALGRVLHREVGRGDARFSPTLQIPVAPGRLDDPERRLRRVVQALTSVRFDAGAVESFESFEARTLDVLAREADGRGLVSRLLAAARVAPLPLVWKRRAVGLSRPRWMWLDRLADVVGGRGCLSKIRVDAAVPPSCAVSSPARMTTDGDPLGACVVTLIDDGVRSALTVCGSGFVGTDALAEAVLQELLDTSAPRAP